MAINSNENNEGERMHTVLLVEDEKRMREIVAAYFETAGYQVVEATNGLEAIDAFESQKIDLVYLIL